MRPKVYNLLHVIIVLLLNSFVTSSQSKNSLHQFDSLRKYTYKIQVYKKGRGDGIASGFFLQIRGKLIFISNYHVFANVNTAEKIKFPTSDMFDSLHIIFYDEASNSSVYHSVDLRSIYFEIVPYYFFEYPDIYIYVFDSPPPKGVRINSIENFLNKMPPKNIRPDSVAAFGYGSILRGNTNLPGFEGFNSVNTIYDNKSISYGPAKITVQVENSYFLTPKSSQGMSGSPLFLKYSNKIYFGGIISTETPTSNFEIAVKPQELVTMLMEKNLF